MISPIFLKCNLNWLPKLVNQFNIPKYIENKANSQSLMKMY